MDRRARRAAEAGDITRACGEVALAAVGEQRPQMNTDERRSIQ